MTDKEIREGDIVEIDYIAEFTKEHINEGKALVIWKGFNHQPLVRKLDTKNTIWTCYEHISKVVGHIDIEGYMDKALEQEPFINKPCVSENVCEHDKNVVLDKIRAEMERVSCVCHASNDYDELIRRSTVLKIIDKYKAESEDKE